ncbi:MAG: serine protease [Vicinamibacterales bacterium]
MTFESVVRVLLTLGLTFVAASTSAQIAITGSSSRPTAAPTAPDRDGNGSRGGARGGGNTADSDTRLADVAEEFKFAVGAVVIVLPNEGAVPFGTAWAFEPNLFATNGHVVELMAQLAQKHPDAAFFVAINQRPDKRLRITAAKGHPLYGKAQVRFDGRATELGGHDIGVLRTADAAPSHFKLASQPQLQALRPGSRIAYLGFPMESLAMGNLDPQNPVATMQSGIVTSLSDYFLGDGGYANNRLLRHNLPSAGGASGSPIFTPDGVVVAIHFGGNHIAGISDDGKAMERKANASLINFAERIDALDGVARP